MVTPRIGLAEEPSSHFVRRMDKALLRDAIVAKIRAELDNQTRAAELSRDEATHEESRPENQYDMHAQEAAYLAEGQARLAKEIAEAIGSYQALSTAPWPAHLPIGIGALVQIAEPRRQVWYYIGPRHGGLEVELNGETVTVVTPASPLGRQLIGARVGQTIALPARPRPATATIAAVA